MTHPYASYEADGTDGGGGNEIQGEQCPHNLDTVDDLGPTITGPLTLDVAPFELLPCRENMESKSRICESTKKGDADGGRSAGRATATGHGRSTQSSGCG